MWYAKRDNEGAPPPALPPGERLRPAGRQEGPRPAEVVTPRPGDGIARLHTIVRHALGLPRWLRRTRRGRRRQRRLGQVPRDGRPARSPALVCPGGRGTSGQGPGGRGPAIARARATLGDATGRRPRRRAEGPVELPPEGTWSLRQSLRAALPEDRRRDPDAILFEPEPEPLDPEPSASSLTPRT